MRERVSSHQTVRSSPPEPTRWDPPTALCADAARSQSFRRVMGKARVLAKYAHEAACKGPTNGLAMQQFAAFMDGLSYRRFDQVRAFLAWGAEASDWSEPEQDLYEFVARFTKRIARRPMLRATWNDALLRPRDFAGYAARALRHARRLAIDIEHVFPAVAPETA